MFCGPLVPVMPSFLCSKTAVSSYLALVNRELRAPVFACHRHGLRLPFVFLLELDKPQSVGPQRVPRYQQVRFLMLVQFLFYFC